MIAIEGLTSTSHALFLFGGIMEKLLQAIYKVVQKKPDTGAFQDMTMPLYRRK